MSDYEHHKGTLVPIREDLTPAEFAEVIYDKIPEYYETKLEFLLEDETYYVNGNNIYIVKDKNTTEDTWYNAELSKDGTIEYDLMFYNGGCGFFEALDDAIDKIKPKG
jgi:hypothetical protein